MKLVPLTQGKFAMVDDEDFDRVMQHKWCASKSRGKFYATCSKFAYKKHKESKCLGIFVLNHNNKNLCVSYIDGNTLNYCKSNLILVLQGTVSQRRKKKKGTTSRFKGVSWSRDKEKWRSIISKNNRSIFIGYFYSEVEAAIAYNDKAVELHGENAKLNII